MTSVRQSIASACIAAATLTAACAGTDEVPTQALALAEANVDRAEREGAREHSAAMLDRAERKLQAARLAIEEDEPARAGRLAEQAAVDAELALAVAEETETRAAATQLQESIAALRAETRRQ